MSEQGKLVIVTPCGFVAKQQSSGRTYCLHLQKTILDTFTAFRTSNLTSHGTLNNSCTVKYSLSSPQSKSSGEIILTEISRFYLSKPFPLTTIWVYSI